VPRRRRVWWETALLVTLAAAGLPALSKQSWGLLAAAMVTVALILMFRGFEDASASAREIALVATLGAVAALARVPFAVLPGVQPTTFLVIVAGLVFGCRAGFMVGATAALVSNFFLGHGPWTPWQMLAWGLAGVSAGYLARFRPRVGRWETAVFGFAWGYLFGWIMNFWFWAAFLHPHDWRSFLAGCAASFWFDTWHAAGNAAFGLLLGEPVTRVCRRFARRLRVDTVPLPSDREASATHRGNEDEGGRAGVGKP